MAPSKLLSNTRRYVGEHGGVIDVDLTGEFTAALVDVIATGADASAMLIKEAIVRTFENEGRIGNYGRWTENEEETLRGKFPETQILRGQPETGQPMKKAIEDSVEILSAGRTAGGRKLTRGGVANIRRSFRASKKVRAKLGLPPGEPFMLEGENIGTTRWVGIFNQDRPEHYHGKTVAEMFAIHEFGNLEAGIPARSLVSRAVDVATQESLEVGAQTIVRAAASVAYELGLEAQLELQQKLLAARTLKRRPTGTRRGSGLIDQDLEREVLGYVSPETKRWGNEMRRASHFDGPTGLGKGSPISQRVTRLEAYSAARSGTLDKAMRAAIANDASLTGAQKMQLYNSYQGLLNKGGFQTIRPVKPSRTGYR